MRFTLPGVVLLGLVGTLPFSHAYPLGEDLAQHDNALSLSAAEIQNNLTLGWDADEDLKRRYDRQTIDPRGIPKLGEKPPPVKPGKDTDISTLGGGKGNDAAEDASGTGSAPKYADGNLEKARAKGETLGIDLDDAIFKNAPEPERKNLESLGYLFHPGHKVPISDGYLDEMNIQVNDAGAWMLRGIYRPDTVAAENILETITDVSQGTIVVKNSWKSNDQAVPKATWTDMVHDNWMDACANADRGAKDPKSLKYVVRDNIQFKDTVDSNGIKLNTPTAMITVFDKLSADKTKTLTIDAKSTNTDVKASYELLSAQTHVARVLQWLKDRHTDLGDKKIAKLHLFHSEHTDGGYNMVIEVA